MKINQCIGTSNKYLIGYFSIDNGYLTFYSLVTSNTVNAISIKKNKIVICILYFVTFFFVDVEVRKPNTYCACACV